ncbi:MAG: WGR domain-containing protein, partial [Clostridiales Family XIII bacterium]|nr:WGR domain-containing protein [Clostridiales Family XIII bacterium]
MERYFIFRKGNSQKFWKIETAGSDCKVTFGKLGTGGQTTEKSFESPEKCESEAEKLIASKVKKGYVESTAEDVMDAKNEGKKYFLSDDFDGVPSLLADRILNDKRLPELKAITIGAWGSTYENSPADILNMMIANKEKFSHIEYLFVGDMDYEICEISWINQCDYGPLLKALPQLQTLIIKGSQGLSLGDCPEHDNLKELQIICGGLPENIANELIDSRLPNLEKLVLYLGVDEYGLGVTRGHLEDLASKSLFPKLKSIGFTNAELGFQDEIVALLLKSDLLPQLEEIDISCGALTDEGGQLLL